MDDALARQGLRHDEFRQRHLVGLALLVLAAHLELQHRVERAARGGGQADAHRHGVLALAVVDRRDVLAGEREPRDAGDLGHRNAVQRRLGGVDAQDDPLRGIEDRVVDRGQVRRLLEDAAHLLRERHLRVVVGTVDLGDDRRQHRRAGRHLDDLDVGAARLRDLLQRRAHRLRDLVALAMPLRLLDEVDLQVADFAAGAQVVLAHQPVEADRRGEPGVGLVVRHFGQLRDFRGEFAQQRRGVLDRRAGRHVDDDLELRLVVERQHLHDDGLHRHQQHRQQDRHRDGAPELPAVGLAALGVQERGHHPMEEHGRGGGPACRRTTARRARRAAGAAPARA